MFWSRLICSSLSILFVVSQSKDDDEDGGLMMGYPKLTDLPRLCGRTSLKKISVCDPLQILGRNDVEASQLDELINRIATNSKCPCTNYVCSNDPEGYKIGVAIANKLFESDDLNIINDEDQYEQNSNNRRKSQRKLEEAAKFAHKVREHWKLGRCDEDIIIVYFHEDKIIYTVTGDMASKLLTNKLITEITGKVLPNGFHRSAFYGLKSILHDYGTVLLNTYQSGSPKTGSAESSSPAVYDMYFRIVCIMICLITFVVNYACI